MRRKFSPLLKATYRDYPHWCEVQRFVKGVASLKPLLILLFGSVATGEFTQDSDADVLVIFDRPVEWLMIYAHSQGMVQPLVKTLDEVLAEIRHGEPFFIEIVEDGLALYDAGGIHQRLIGEAAKAKREWGLTRTADGWEWKKQQG
ncbi:MAG: nucleotidyltransferase domain-containing protein [candidate division WOR-3 bacterium]